MPDETPELYDTEGRTPSQRELDAATEGDQIANALRAQGQLTEAKRQIQIRIARGGSKEEGRELLGEVDALLQGGDSDAAARFAQGLDSYIQGGAVAARPPAAPVKQAAARSKAADNQRLLDPDTPHDELVAIRAKQKAAGEW